MRRIILACLAVTLTACDTARPDAPAPSGSDAAGVPSTTATAATEADDVRGTILFVGTSLTAGYGVGADAAYPSLIQEKIDSVELPFRVVNAGISGETSAGGLRRIDWSLQQPADVLVLELGANDALRGLDPADMRRNLDAILRRAREVDPGMSVVIVGMEAPPNLGDRYTRAFREVFTSLAREHDAELVPFLLDGVAAEPSLNLEDGMHPNVEGHRILAGTVWRVLEPVLVQLAGERTAG